MGDIAIILDNAAGRIDYRLDGVDLAQDDGIETAITLSLLCDARAGDDDHIADKKSGLLGTGDRRGWWGDAYGSITGDATGSKIWTLVPGKATDDALVLADAFCTDALQWLIDDGYAVAIDAKCRAVDSVLYLQGMITLSDGTTHAYRVAR